MLRCAVHTYLTVETSVPRFLGQGTDIRASGRRNASLRVAGDRRTSEVGNRKDALELPLFVLLVRLGLRIFKGGRLHSFGPATKVFFLARFAQRPKVVGCIVRRPGRHGGRFAPVRPANLLIVLLLDQSDQIPHSVLFNSLILAVDILFGERILVAAECGRLVVRRQQSIATDLSAVSFRRHSFFAHLALLCHGQSQSIARSNRQQRPKAAQWSSSVIALPLRDAGLARARFEMTRDLTRSWRRDRICHGVEVDAPTIMDNDTQARLFARSTKGKSPRTKEDLNPYCYVNGCDGVSSFSLHGVHPNLDGSFTVYTIICRWLGGVRDGYVAPSVNTDFREMAAQFKSLVVKITIPEAVALFLDPLVAQTASIPDDAIPCIRWFEKHGRRPGPHRGENLIPRLMTEDELAANAKYDSFASLRRLDLMQCLNEDSYEQLMEHHDAFETFWFKSPAGECHRLHWILSQGDLTEIGIDPLVPLQDVADFQDKLVACERIVQRQWLMTQHMRLICTLLGEAELASMWAKDVEISRERFVESGQVQCLIRMVVYLTSSTPSMPRNKRFFCRDPLSEKQLVLALRALAVLTLFCCQMDDQENLLLRDYYRECGIMLNNGVGNAFDTARSQLPNFDHVLDDKKISEIGEVLLYEMTTCHLGFLMGGPSNFTKDSSEIEKIASTVSAIFASDANFVLHAEWLGREMAQGFWEIAGMAVHPELFDYPDTPNLGGRGVWKENPPQIIGPPPMASLEEVVVLVVKGYSNMVNWVHRFTSFKSKQLKSLLTFEFDGTEKAVVDEKLCPQYFERIDDTTIRPSAMFLERLAKKGDVAFLLDLMDTMATLVPRTTMNFLLKAFDLALKRSEDGTKKIADMERHKSSSTTKQKWHCVACGATAAAEGGLMKCSRCKVARYCKYLDG